MEEKQSSTNLEKVQRIDRMGELRAVIETPRGSRNKYSHDSKENLFLLKKVLPAGMSFPYDFGYIPQTEAEDGDPLDVLVLMDEPAFPGCVLQIRLIGLIEAEEKNEGKTVRNDRLIAVAIQSRAHREAKNLSELGDEFVKDLEKFFETYQKLEGKEFRILGRKDAKEAERSMESKAA